jgi:hypothetical protein
MASHTTRGAPLCSSSGCSSEYFMKYSNRLFALDIVGDADGLGFRLLGPRDPLELKGIERTLDVPVAGLSKHLVIWSIELGFCSLHVRIAIRQPADSMSEVL